MFYMAGELFSKGEYEDVYRYIGNEETRANLPHVWDEYLTNNMGWGTYFYAQAPWHAMAMTLLAKLNFRDAYLYANILNITALCLAGLGLFATTRRNFLWNALLLLAPILLPVLGGYQWETPMFQWQWSPLQATEVGNRGNALAAAIWLAQPTPVYLLFVVAFFIAAIRKQWLLVGLFAVLALMKPSVMVALPLVLLLVDWRDWGKVVLSCYVWGSLAFIVSALVPGLGFPLTYLKVAASYDFLPNIAQTHNWVWIYGSIIAAVALKFDRKEYV